jgi:cell division protein FtsQ
MLPADEPERALAAIASLDREQAVLSREVAALDLRMPGQFIVRLTDEGLLARKAMLKEREKVARRGRTNT